MNKTELIAAVAEKIGDSNSKAANTINTILEVIADSLEAGNGVAITGFGTFDVMQTKARTGRNPQTGESIDIPAKRVVKFKPGKNLKERLNQMPF